MSNKVTYAEIIAALSEKTGFSKQKSEAFSKALIARVKEELQENGKASITNFGSFKVKEVAEREGQNPQTGEPIVIPAHKRVAFTPYKALKEEVNSEFADLETELIPESDSDSKSPEKKEKQTEPASENKPEEKEPLDPTPNTVFQFDEESEEGDDVQDTEDPETQSEEPEDDDPFAFDEENEPKEVEQVPDPFEKVSEEGPETAEDHVFTREGKKEGMSTAAWLLAVLIPIVIIALSLWLFLSPGDRNEGTPQQASVEESQTSTATPAEEMEQPEKNEESMAAASESANTGNQSTAESASMSSTTYQVNEDEWYWVIANKVYGRSHYWPLIYQQNFTTDHHPDSLETNMQLAIPALEGSAGSLTTRDYQRLSAAAQMVSDAYEKFGRSDKAREYARFAENWRARGME